MFHEKVPGWSRHDDDEKKKEMNRRKLQRLGIDWCMCVFGGPGTFFFGFGFGFLCM